ncbi:MAG: M1 family metallopeptidase [Gemmatimonadales bacterium]|nr:M1 family metallopeptidase [Gemmatimonadales bacterium]
MVALPLAAQTRPGSLIGQPGVVPPSETRLPDGRPGPGYWQQRVDYRIGATLDPFTGRLSGRETIRYRNNAPVRLAALWLHLEQNICDPDGVTSQLRQPPLVFLSTAFDFTCQGFAGGVTLDTVRAAGRVATYAVYGTLMRLDLPYAIDRGESIELEIAWHFTVPPYGAGRMGRDGTLFEVAQWYPRLAVYDDVSGWNHDPYIGAGEFYLEYGSFDVRLTLPAGFTVAATGTLRNPGEVLGRAQRERLALAARSDTAIAVITADEATRTSASARPLATWHFTADSVRDFAFAASPDFRWDASAWDGILVHTFYRPAATRWPEANRMAREAVRHFSERWFRYPYPQMSSVEGPIEGMEYPMLTFDPAGPSREELHWVVAHEIGHQWVPMVVGSNERLHPWMDEGFNTFLDLENAALYFAGTAYGDTITTSARRLYPSHAVPGQEQPMATRPVESRDLFWTGYQKPALMLSVLRDEVLGRERFERAFRAYLQAWRFKHPTPGDFQRMMRAESGVDLDWFWRDWLYTTHRPDVVVERVASDARGSTVGLLNRGGMQLPTRLRLTYADGSSGEVVVPVEAWNLGPRFEYRAPAGTSVTGAVVVPPVPLATP